MRRTALARLALPAIALIAPDVARSQWNARSDFSIASNPNGAWTYGIRTTLASTSLTPYTVRGIAQGSQAYQSDNSYAAPGVFQNISNGTAVYYGSVQMAPGQLAFHPGPGGEFSVVRFTAPTAGTYGLSASFVGVDFANGGTSSDVNVVIDGTVVFTGLINGYGASRYFATAMTLGAGSFVDFAVGFGSNGNWYSDSTGLEAEIDSISTIPEPESLVLFGTGLAGLLALSRRRRSALRE